MRDVQVQFSKLSNYPPPPTMQVKLAKGVDERWDNKQQGEATKYYGKDPHQLEGIEVFITNSERQECFRRSACTDLTKHTPVKTNQPHMNVLLNNQYKVRGIWDSGCTNTVMSKGLYDEIYPFPMETTTAEYQGVNDQKESYVGVIPALPVRLTDKLHTTLRVNVLPTKEKYLLLGNDLIGGQNAAFAKIGGADIHCQMTLQNQDSVQDIVQFIRAKGIPFVASTHAVKDQVPPEGPDEVEQLFLT